MNLTDHISRSGLKRAQICTATGISRGMLSQIERGKRRIGAEKAALFAAALGLSVRVVRPDLANLFTSTQPPEDAT
ncbi:helix-turn-helix domain-containing protein [Paracoccus aminophilus]|uniref:helix-turn-helix domain-containing protein n=1 Tax=Paracoccus aminophilus TaxID=34003 RepID=UPI000A04BA66|nr:helix-turn-helix transcriptional regulator [Paracoccus aminophilus]